MSVASRERFRSVSSRHNAQVKELRRALRKAEPTARGLCAIEGEHLLVEALGSGLELGTVFFSHSARERSAALLEKLPPRTEVLLLPDDVFAGAVATETPPGIAALVRLPRCTLQDVLRNPEPLAVVLAGLQDPGNLGTILRSAEAFGASGVILAEGCVSPYNPKAVRASAGSLFRLPVVDVAFGALRRELPASNVRLLATSSHHGQPADQADLRGALALLLGGEGGGLPSELLAAADLTITIPHSRRVESLNAATAAAVLLYEISRQRAKTGAQP